MLSTRLFPMATFDDLRGGLDRVLDVFDNGAPSSLVPRVNRVPAINAWDDDDSVFVEVEAPGIPLENLDIEVLGRALTISGTREDSRGEDAPYYWRERTYGSFTRHMKLNVDIDAEKVKAVLKDGVLTITLPKVASAKPQRITVKPE